jgi:KDO2-lipid IV(A) lauroyltransferase
VVHENLIRSFPEKSQEEILLITKKYYHHLCDLGLEILKYSRMTEDELDRRIKFQNLDIYNEFFQQGKSIILLGMHYNNWEWSTSLPRYANAQFIGIYNAIRNNKQLEKFIINMRQRFGTKVIEINHSTRTLFEFHNSENPKVLALVADQSAPKSSEFWTIFLNQETSFFMGPMRIAMKSNQPVMLHHTKKVGRGKYEVFHYKLVENPSEVSPEYIMSAYIQKMEEIIKDEPEYWLWSHRRWKLKRPKNLQLHDRFKLMSEDITKNNSIELIDKN